MKAVFQTYGPNEFIPVVNFIKNRKLLKYFNRETSAAIVAVGSLLRGQALNPDTPFFYATGFLEYEDYGLAEVAAASVDQHGKFSQRLFVEKGLSSISPLNQFKVLQNMPYSFVCIEYQLRGDNAVIHSSASALLACAVSSTWEGPVLVGAGKVYSDARVEVGFALAYPGEIQASCTSCAEGEAIEIFRSVATGGGLQ